SAAWWEKKSGAARWCWPSSRIEPHGDDAHPDVLVAALRLEALAERHPAGPPRIREAAAPPRPGLGAVAAGFPPGVRQVGIHAAGESFVDPVAAPLVDVAASVEEPPRVRGVAGDLDRLVERRPLGGGAVRRPEEVRLRAAPLRPQVAGRRRAGARH